MEGASRKAIWIIKILALSGARRGEIVQLKWSEVSFDQSSLYFDDSKTGQKTIPVSTEVVTLLKEVWSERDTKSSFVFPNASGNSPYVGTPKVWTELRRRFGDDKLRLHDLRHTFASLAVAGGASLPMIGALLGHKDATTTQQYAHLTDDPLRSISEQISAKILAGLNERKP